jgi:hypothetical protein
MKSETNATSRDESSKNAIFSPFIFFSIFIIFLFLFIDDIRPFFFIDRMRLLAREDPAPAPIEPP